MAQTERRIEAVPVAAAARMAPARDPMHWLDVAVFALFFLMVL